MTGEAATAAARSGWKTAPSVTRDRARGREAVRFQMVTGGSSSGAWRLEIEAKQPSGLSSAVQSGKTVRGLASVLAS
ncbi:hypothetical protein VTK26DRAFT_8725 [Humicola hyalothermophila]